MLAACTPSELSREQRDVIASEVEARFDSLVTAVERGDTLAYFAHFDDRAFTSLNASGTVTTDFDLFRVDYLEGAGAIAGYQSLDFPVKDIRVLDADTAVLVNEYQGRVRLTDGSVVDIAGAGQQVWQKMGDTWMLVSVGSSVRAADPEADEAAEGVVDPATDTL